jgi:hypothetical protein
MPDFANAKYTPLATSSFLIRPEPELMVLFQAISRTWSSPTGAPGHAFRLLSWVGNPIRDS